MTAPATLPETPLHQWLDVEDVADYFAANLTGTDDRAIAVAAERTAVNFSMTANFGADDADARYRLMNFDALLDELRARVASGDITPHLAPSAPRTDTGREQRYANHPFYSPKARFELEGEDSAVAAFGADAVREALGGELPSEKEARLAAEEAERLAAEESKDESGSDSETEA